MSDILRLSESESESESEAIGLASGNLVGLIGPLVRPGGISPSRQRHEGAFVGENWPPALTAQGWRPAPVLARADDTFTRLFGPGSPWDADHYPMVILAEFLERFHDRWHLFELPGHDANAEQEAARLVRELGELVEIMEYRPSMMAEALAQANGILNYFRGVFTFTAKSHPMTFALGRIAVCIGEFVVMHYKGRINRPRPSRLSSRVAPQIEVPGHAAYPSGHATQSRLVARLLTEVMPVEAEPPLYRLAERIARNREVMGLHYRSDSDGGVSLADQIFEFLRQCDTVSRMIDQAKKEWGRVDAPKNAARAQTG